MERVPCFPESKGFLSHKKLAGMNPEMLDSERVCGHTAMSAAGPPARGIPKQEMIMNTPGIIIRDEKEFDTNIITGITVAAFADMEISDHTEQFVIMALRSAGALSMSLVAEVDGRVVGHIAFSPVEISDGTRDWYGLGPVSVRPEYQRRGIGKALIREGLARLKSMNARGCCLVGHPDYYPQFGFENVPGMVVAGVPAEAFFALSFDGNMPRGDVRFHEAFLAKGE